MMLVCLECGNGEVSATLTARIEYNYEVGEGGMLETGAQSVVDGGDLGDVDEFACTDCGEVFESPETEWISQEAYDHAELSS